MDNINKLHEDRTNLINKARAIMTAADGRSLSADEAQTFDRIMSDADAIKGSIDRQAALDAAAASEVRKTPERKTEATIEKKGNQSNFRASDEYRKAFDRYCRVGINGLMPDELRAMNETTGSEGGYMVETVLERVFIESLSQSNVMRGLCPVINTSSDRNFAVETDVGSAAWTAEAAAFTLSDPVLAQVAFSAHSAGTIVKVSDQLMQDSVFDVSSYLGRAFGRRVGTLEEAAFVNGDGSGKPGGIFPAAGIGVTAAGATAITGDEIIDLFHSLAPQYRTNAKWLMNDSTAKLIRKLVDGNGQYIWQPGLAAGSPDMLLGKPVYVSAAAPAATSGLRSICFADTSFYYIVDRGSFNIQRLNELYAANGQVGFRGWKRTDGNLTLAAAAKVLVQA